MTLASLGRYLGWSLLALLGLLLSGHEAMREAMRGMRLLRCYGVARMKRDEWSGEILNLPGLVSHVARGRL